jgi:hypothetical protein
MSIIIVVIARYDQTKGEMNRACICMEDEIRTANNVLIAKHEKKDHLEDWV